jgi:hypothetical protein
MGTFVKTVLFAAPLLAACGQPDPTTLDRVGYGSNQGTATATDASLPDPSPTTDASAGGTDAPNDAAAALDAPSVGAKPDAEVDAAPPPIDASPANAFTGDNAYVATTGPSAENAAHNFPANNPTTNPAGQVCLSCHGAAGPGKAFLLGGTVWTTAAANAAAPQVEVRVRDDNANGFPAYTDGDGNFFVLVGDGGAFSPPAHPGLRNATTTDLMTGAIDNGDCNACHRAGGQTPLHLQ